MPSATQLRHAAETCTTHVVDVGDTTAQVNWVVEEDTVPAYGSTDSPRGVLASATATLSMAVLGSSVLPIPYAMARTGVLSCLLTMLAVASANALTSRILIRATALTGHDSYDSLAQWAGGRVWKVITQASLVLLLFGTMCGGLSLLSDVGGTLATLAASTIDLPSWLDGRVVCCTCVVLVLLPLSCQRHMRQLDKAATAGLAVVVGLIFIVGVRAFRAGFPAVRSGDLTLWSIKVDEHLPEAFSIIGYAFYMQPMMMPMMREVPPGPVGVKVMCNAITIVLFGVAFTVYACMGFFGASLFGSATAGNILDNAVLHSRVGTLWLYTAMALYLAVGMTSTQKALDVCVDEMLRGPVVPFTWTWQVCRTSVLLAASTAVALAFKHGSARIFGITGASAVCVICYIIPVFIELQIYRRTVEAKKVHNQDLLSPLLPSDTPFTRPPPQHPAHKRRRAYADFAQHVALPLAVAGLGCGFSAAALYIAARDWGR